MYKKVLENLRKEIETPVEPILPSPRKNNLVPQREEKVEAPTDPLSLMKEWHQRIKQSSSKFQQQAAETKLSSNKATSFLKGVEENISKDDNKLVKRPSAFSGDTSLVRNGEDVGEFSLDIDGASSLIRSKEGFRETPYWDVNAYRVGYGSDTITKADGSVIRVTPGVHVTKEDAERDLERRIGEFTSKAVSKVGELNWEPLPEKAKAALVSVTYNYGHLPNDVAEAVKTGSLSSIADAVERLKSHNEGINKKRRLHEAALIRSGV